VNPVVIGNVELYLGDARDVLPTLENVDVVITDPPYSSGRSEVEFAATGNVAVILHMASEKAPTMMVFGTSSGRGIEFIRSCIRSLPHCRSLAWHRSYVNSPAGGPWRWDLVLIHVFGKGVFGRPERSSLMQTSGTQALAVQVGHKAPIPEELGQWLYEPFAPGTVLDPFCGSGGLLIAPMRLGAKCIGIEADEANFNIACERIDNAQRQARMFG
jgi:DNA modification methylase